MRAAIGTVGLAICAAFVLLVTLTPTPVDAGLRGSIDKVLDKLHAHGLPTWFQYPQLEFISNVAVFVPIGFFLALLVPWRAWWLCILIGPVFSGALEFAQGAFLPDRFSSVGDVIANSIGSLVGSIAAFALRSVVEARDRRVIAAAAAAAVR